MFIYDKADSEIIISCTLAGLNKNDVDQRNIFSKGSIWTDHKLMYIIIGPYVASYGWL